MYNFSLQIDDSAISHFLVSRFLQILTKPAIRFKFLSFLLMHGIFTLGWEVFSARLTPYLWYKLRFCLDVSAADASTQRSLLLLNYYYWRLHSDILILKLLLACSSKRC
jgi:hypothetical protein